LRGFHQKTGDFLTHGHGAYIELTPSSSRPEPPHQPTHNPFVAVIPKGRTIYDHGAVIAPDHRLLADVSWPELVLRESQPKFHSAMRTMCLPQIQKIHGSVAVISSVKPDNYYHWMFDILPRIGILRQSGKNSDYYLVNTDTLFQQESLSLLNIPQPKIINPTKCSHIQADTLIVPSLPGPLFSETPQELACKFLQSAFLSGFKKTPHRRLYISRSDAQQRRVTNESEVRELILPLGFDVLTLNGMSFDKQVQLFAEAMVVLGPHGAGLSNAVFCQPGSTLIEFLPKSRSFIDCFERLAGLAGMAYYKIAGEDDPARRSPDMSEDYTVDISELGQTLHRVLGIA